MRIAPVSLMFLILLTAPAAGRDLFVSNTGGDDTFSGRQTRNAPDRSGPLRTIARALQLAVAGDRIVLIPSDEPYRESISLVGNRHSGYPHQSFTIEGNGATLDGAAPVPPEAWEHFRGPVFRFRPPGKAHQQLFLDNLPADRVAVDRFQVGPPKLEKLQWCLHGGHIYFCVEADKLPSDYPLTYARLQTGITLYHVRRVAIVDLTVQGFQLDGINAHNSAREVHLSGVVSRGNGRAGVTTGGASQVEIDLSTIGNNGRAQVLTMPYSRTSIRNSNVFSNTAPAWVDRGGKMDVDGEPVEDGIDGGDITAGGEAGQ
ncbi:MAG: right-handed parallel beta-helix repeat-containing protein [Candidatus Nealsonbacteria bacterium]|nr:right-handed parallel beta-helix repeat-containing protein [Candidatus Nealsonbacteria bacterium]